MPDLTGIQQEIAGYLSAGGRPDAAFHKARHNHITRLFNKRGRNVIVYYSGWLSPSSRPNDTSLMVSDLDKNGFMTCIHEVDCNAGLDLILHLPGGSLAATESLIAYLRAMFDGNIETFVPQLAMSGGTMLSFMGRTIHMGKESNLGPIDPQFGTTSAVGVLKELEYALEEIKTNQQRLLYWGPIFDKLRPGQVQAFRQAIQWSKVVGSEALSKGMFIGDADAPKKIDTIINSLTVEDHNLAHDRHFHIDELSKMGLNITALETDPELQDIVLSIHHAFMTSIINEQLGKLIENHLKKSFMLKAVI